MFKNLLKQQFKSDINKGTVTVKEGRDTAANKVDVTLKVGKKNSRFTINLYNTTSRAMINGKNQDHFLKDFNKIKAKFENVPLSELNKKLEVHLQVASENVINGGITGEAHATAQDDQCVVASDNAEILALQADST